MNEFNLTTQEQLLLVNGGSFFGTNGLPEKDIPRLQLLDGGTGMNFEQLFGDFLSAEGKEGIGSYALRNVLEYFYTPEKLPDEESKALYNWIFNKLKERIPSMTAPGCYPPGILLGATWNPEVIYAVGQALGMEASAYGVNVLLGTPNVNLHRDIRNGRLFEGYSEDPCLVSQLAPELVKGVQSQGVAANVKHFAANHQETNRLNINEHIPERALHELYYPGFKACVEAGVATVMSAYNQINGVPCTENRELLCDILRDTWGFDSIVMSDWGAVYHPAAAVNAGNDLAMPGPIAPDTLAAALEDGSLSAEALALSANRIAKFAKQYGKKSNGEISLELTDTAAYSAAAEGIVLLKNDNDVLPLDANSDIALFGKHAEYLLTCGEGSAGIHTNRNVSFYKALTNRFENVSLSYTNDNSNTLIYVAHLPGQEGNDRADISLSADITQEIDKLLKQPDIKTMKKILVLNVSGPVALNGIENDFDAIICTFLPGMQGAAALADILCGKVNPSGKLPLSWPKRLEDMPTHLNFPGDGMQVYYGEGIFVGYRWYDARKIKPLYSFGHGLSYTQFSIKSINADNEVFTDSVTVKATVANTGKYDGKTVVQIYISDVLSTLTKPVRELKAFKKVFLKAGECKEISFTLDRHAFESYDPNLHEWTMEEGRYIVSAAFSAEDQQASCEVYADVESPYSYGAKTSVKIIMENELLRNCVSDFFKNEGFLWSAMLTSYEYTAQDTIELILSQVGCHDTKKEELYNLMQNIKKQ